MSIKLSALSLFKSLIAFYAERLFSRSLWEKSHLYHTSAFIVLLHNDRGIDALIVNTSTQKMNFPILGSFPAPSPSNRAQMKSLGPTVVPGDRL